MRLIDALTHVIKTKENEGNIDEYEFGISVGVSEPIPWHDFNDAVKAYWVSKHCCTDTWVGDAAIYLNNKLVAMTSQDARKSEYNIYYLNNECAEEMRTFILGLVDAQECTYQVLGDNLFNEIHDFTNCDYTQQIIDKTGFYNGKPVIYRGDGDPSNYVSTLVKVSYANEADYIADTMKVLWPANPEHFVIQVHEFMIPLAVNITKEAG